MTIKTNFQPRRRLISAISNEQKATVTTTEDHGYDAGEFVVLFVPLGHGMRFEFQEAKVLSVPSSTTFTINVDTTNKDAFSAPSTPPFTPAQVTYITGPTVNDTSITG